MSRSNRIKTNPYESFICKSCGRGVSPITHGGSQRNHCPHCLSSLHVDILPGDRRSACKGVMDPISLWIKKDREWAVIHRCSSCGVIRTNRIAADDNEMFLFTLAASFMTQLPFPGGKAIESLITMSRNMIKEGSYES